MKGDNRMNEKQWTEEVVSGNLIDFGTPILDVYAVSFTLRADEKLSSIIGLDYTILGDVLGLVENEGEKVLVLHIHGLPDVEDFCVGLFITEEEAHEVKSWILRKTKFLQYG